MKPNSFTMIAFELAGSSRRRKSFAILAGALVLAAYYYAFHNFMWGAAAGSFAALAAYAVIEVFMMLVMADLYGALQKHPSLAISLTYPFEKAEARIARVLESRGVQFFDSRNLHGAARMAIGLGKGRVIVCRSPAVALSLSEKSSPPIRVYWDGSDGPASTLAEVIKTKVQLS